MEFKKKYKLVVYSSSLKGIWDQIVKKSKNGNFLFYRDYMDYHKDRFDEQSLVIYENEKAQAVFPCNRSDDTIISHSGLTYAGLIYDRDMHSIDVLNIFKLLLDYYSKLGAKKILYKAIPSVFNNYPAEEDLYALFRFGAYLYRRDLSSVIKLDDRILFSDSRKCTIRKAIKLNVEVMEWEGIKEFHNLLSEVLSKFGASPVHSSDELSILMDRFPGNIRLFGAFLDKRLLAGTVVYDFGHIVHTQYMASSNEGRKNGALDFLLSYLIEDIFKKKSYFSFGVSTEDEGNYLNKGLIFQKEGFGGRGISHDFYKIDLENYHVC